MKKILSFLTLILVLSSSMVAQTADEIITKHIAARGGLDKLKSLQTMKMEATISIQGMDIPIKIFAADKKAFKLEMIVMDNMGYQLVTSTKGWTYLPFQGHTEPQEMKAEDVAAAQGQLDMQGPLVDYQSKGIKVEYTGKETVEGKPCSVLKITRANGLKGVFYLDDKFLILKKTETVKVNGQDVEQSVTYHTYQTSPEGYVYATSWTSANGGEINVTKFEPNAKIDEAVFKP
jgi:outer membrane lipoprotein-sorting protein